MTTNEQIASFLVRTDLEIPREAYTYAVNSFIDGIGVILVGSQEPVSKLIKQYIGVANPSESIMITDKDGVSASETALVNSVMAHALDYDDTSDAIGGHPTAVILPALLAIGEKLRCCGKEILEAYILGLEVEAKLAKLVNFEHYERGWHPTSTLGTFGAVAACAKLMKLDHEQIILALGVAASMASGIKANFGSMCKPLQAGLASRNGAMAATLASLGFTSHKDVMEAKHGFFEVYNGKGQYRLDDLTVLLGRDWEIVNPGLAIKQYPCCGSTHSAIDAMIYLKRTHGIKAEDIESVDIYIHPRRLAHTNRPDPRTQMEGKFSVQYVVALAALKGSVALNDFDDSLINSAEIRGLLKKVRGLAMPQEKWGNEHFAAEVEVNCTGNKKYSYRVEKAKGRGPKLALSTEELKNKFYDCASQALSSDKVERLYEVLSNFENLDNLYELFSLLTY